MTAMTKTVSAIAELPPNIRTGEGSHTERRASIGAVGDVLGDIEFDPGEHQPANINPTSMLAEVLGTPHVRQVERGRPVGIRLIVDAFRNEEHPAVTEAKIRAAQSLAELLHQGIRETSNRLQVFSVGESMSDRLHDMRPTTVRDDDEFVEIASRGLAIVISDDFDALQAERSTSFPTLIGVKLNHPAELHIPAGINFIPLGGWSEINTNKTEQYIYVNERLRAHHRQIKGSLESAGAVVASVVTDPPHLNGFDVLNADQNIASAIRQLA